MTVYLGLNVAANENWLGGAVYLQNLLRTLECLPSKLQPRVLIQVSPDSDPKLVAELRRSSVVVGECKIPIGHGFFAKVARRLQYFGRQPELWFPVFGLSHLPRRELYWIPDFQHHFLPEMFSGEELQLRDSCYQHIANASGHVLLSSQTALAHFQQFYSNARVKPHVWSFVSDVSVANIPAPHLIIEKYGLPSKFLYLPNQFWRHKNHQVVLEALARLRESKIHIPLVLTGHPHDYRHPDHYQGLLQFIAEQQLSSQIHMLGVIPRAEQLAIFRAAALVIQPSLFEGWSTVIEDAKTLAKRMLVSDIPIHREQLTNQPETIYFGPNNPQDLAARLVHLWDQAHAGPDLAAELVAQQILPSRQINAAKQFMRIIHLTLDRPIPAELAENMHVVQ